MSLSQARPDWMSQAACAQYEDHELLDAILFSERNSGNRQHPSTGREQQARRLCAFCPVRRECLLFACSTETQEGTYGGVHARERMAVRHLSLEERVRALDAVFQERVGSVLVAGERPIV